MVEEVLQNRQRTWKGKAQASGSAGSGVQGRCGLRGGVRERSGEGKREEEGGRRVLRAMGVVYSPSGAGGGERVLQARCSSAEPASRACRDKATESADAPREGASAPV